MAGEGATGTVNETDRRAVARPRWEPALEGIFVMVMGVVLLGYPDIALEDITLMVGTVLLVDGIFLALGSFALKAADPLWSLVLLGGIASVVVSGFLLGRTDLGADVVLWLLGAWALGVGVANMVWGIARRRDAVVAGSSSFAGVGVFGVIFGLVALTWPDATVLSMLNSVGIFALWFGFLMIIAGYRSTGE